ncbi:MAG TPA: AraC family transcriptional regulator [Kiritimatiellia bacterium]|nr:AraC family transcriptional regulator [Kiritimatiellia bacterium]
MKLKMARRANVAAVRLCDPPQIFIGPSNWTWNTRIPGYFNLWIALRGSGVMQIDGVTHVIEPGVAFLLAPGCQISARHENGDPPHNLAVHLLPLDARGRVIDRPNFPAGPVQVRDLALTDLVARRLARLRQAGATEADETEACWAHALLMQMLQDARTAPVHPIDAKILRLAERISVNPGGAGRVSELAREAGLSRVQFTRRFKRVLGESPISFIVRHRVERAAHLVEHSPLKFADIAESLGYSDVFFFSRQFKRVKGFQPSRLRRGQSGAPRDRTPVGAGARRVR